MATVKETLRQGMGERPLVRLVLALAALVLALLALALAGGMWLYLVQTGHVRTGYALDVRVPDAQGTPTGAPVRMAGVQIGTVADVTLVGRQADLRLDIKQGSEVPRGSRFLVASPMLDPPGGVRVILPAGAASGDALRPGDGPLAGETGPSPADTMAQAIRLMAMATQATQQMDTVLHNANGLMTDRHLQKDVTQTLDNARAASANGVQVTRQMQGLLGQTRGLLGQTQAGSQKLLTNMAQASAQVAATARDSRTQIGGILGDVHKTTGAVSGLTTKTTQFLQSPPALKVMAGMVGDLKGTLSNLKSTTDHLNALTAAGAKLSGDPQVQGDLKDTLHNVRDLTAKTNTLLDALTKAATAAKPGR